MFYYVQMVSGDLIREARFRAGLTQAELGDRLGKAQSEVGRWERGAVTPSLETLRLLIRACDLDLSLSLWRRDDSNRSLIEQTLAMTPAERFQVLQQDIAFQARVERVRAPG